VRYISTRGRAAALAFDDAVLAGLAGDGGLYLPEEWPQLTAAELSAMGGLDYPALAARVLAPFAAPAISEAELHSVAVEAYRGFDHPEIAPLTRIGEREWLLELTHGPTLAFKDYALQFLGRLFDRVLARRGERVTILGATSGDTGSAAIEACRRCDRIDIFILHPKGRVSEVQRRQMTTVTAGNVHNIAVEGTFDDCQALVKAMFNDDGLRRRLRLAAVNSINWVRIAAQVVYYVRAALRLGAPEREVAFSVPTGNFGNAFAGYVAARLGLPVRRLIIGSNRNDILTRFFATGRMERSEVVPTLSPSMDIQVSSNFERLLFDLYDRDGAAVASLLREFAETGAFTVDGERLRRAGAQFAAARFDDAETCRVMRRVLEETGVLLDPHSAIGVAAARAWLATDSVPVVALATAHPAKFPDAVEAATGIRPELPAALADLFARRERYVTLPAEVAALTRHLTASLARRQVPA
jgi:threonine synthase